jgi:DNA polymerase III subunit alpha
MADDHPVPTNAKNADFVHLHLHTEYSLLDGSVRIRDLMHRSATLGMPAVAMTDHGNLFGAIEFYQTAKKYDVKPLVGCELYLTPPGVSYKEKRKMPGERKTSHLTVLTQNATGFANLTKLVSFAHLDGFYYKPRVDRELLASHSEGLICLSGCLQGEINQFIQDGMIEEARRSVGDFVDIFGKDRFFLEIQDHGMEAQAKCTRQILEFAREFGLQPVATNDVHFLNRADHDGHDVLICIGTNRMVLDENRMRYSPEMYCKGAEEMKKLFREVPEAISNTLRIAEMCDLQIKLDSASIEKYPVFDSPDGSSREDYFRRVSVEGLVRRYGEERVRTDPDLLKRLDYEISIIQKMGFISYFLIVWDFIKWAKDHGIPVGPGRGSAAGSLVAYSLGITDICPLRFGLIFERFLNPERISPPDVDVDFCQDRRPEVIDYVRRKYGERSVSHIVTFSTLGAKSVLRDVSRVMGLSYDEGDRIAKMIPNELNITLAQAREMNPELKDAIEREQATREVFEAASFLEGLKRGTGVHAAGIVIADRDLTDMVALARSKDGVATTQYAMEPLTELGMLKMDFLGLKTLTVVQDTVKLIRKHSPDFDASKIPLDDRATFELLNRGETCGVFQLESGGMVNLCKQFEIQSIDDIIALIALYRPGPMEFIPSYIARKKGKEQVAYPHPLYEEIARETYGILIYQEQVQRAANVLAGYSLGQADLLRRAMGKKKKSIMDQERIKFVEGAKRVNGIESKQANEIFDTLAKFAEYGFNKSHSAAYGFISYQTAYLKANYPVEFMAGLLSNEINNTDKISVFVAECQRMGIRILPPDMNKSLLQFAPEPGVDRFGDPIRAIRFGLSAIKNVGEGAMEISVRERESHGAFQGLVDFANRVDSRTINKKILETLVRAGAFDFTGSKRSQLFARIESCLSAASSVQRDRSAGQGSLFGLDEMVARSAGPEEQEDDLEEWPLPERLAHEKDLLGFYVTGHPLDAYRMSFRKGGFRNLSQLEQVPDKPQPVKFAGLINELAIKYSKRGGKPFAIVTLEDFSGIGEFAVFGDAYATGTSLLQKGNVIQIRAAFEKDRRGEGLRLNVQEVSTLKAIPYDPAEFEKKEVEAPIQPLELILDAAIDNVSDLRRIHAIAQHHRGLSPLRLRVHQPGKADRVILVHRKFWINATEEAKSDLAPWLNA